jgi:hypothetical protein
VVAVVTWHPLEDTAGGLRAVVDGTPAYVFPTRVFGWSWHTMPADGLGVRGYAPTVEAAQTLAEQAARAEE